MPELSTSGLTLAIYQPDIPQNTGTMLRTCACFGVAAAIIEPAGFPVSDRAFRRAGMDYLDNVPLTRHNSWDDFEQWRKNRQSRLILLTTKAAQSHTSCSYQPDDILLVGRETSGVPDAVHDSADLRVSIAMRPDLRSLNVAISAAVVMAEALRQLSAQQKQ